MESYRNLISFILGIAGMVVLVLLTINQGV